MKTSQIIRELEVFQEVQEAGFILQDEFKPKLNRSLIQQEELEGIVMRLYFLTLDPEKKIRFFINQYAEGRFLYLTKITEGAWLFLLSADNNFARLHFFMKYLLADGSLEIDEEHSGPAHNDHKLLSAKRIQELLFADMARATRRFKSYHLWYQPRDFIGGDFYWARETRHHQWLVVGDCTGHSIEGALASVSIMSVLNQVFEADMAPHMLIKRLHKSLNDIQNQNLVEGYGIGCEMIAMKYEFSTRTLYFSSTGLPLLVMGASKRMFKGRKSMDQNLLVKFLRSKKVLVGEEESVVTYSDGVVDQIGPNGKRIKTKKLLQQVAGAEEFDPAVLKDMFNQWKGSELQTDDVVFLSFQP